MKRLNGQDITELLFGERKVLLTALKKSCTLIVCVDLATEQVLSVEVKDDALIEHVSSYSWEDLTEVLLEHTVYDHRARVRSFLDHSVIDKLKETESITFSFKHNMHSADHTFRWYDVSVQRISVDNKDLLLYLATDSTDAVNERKALLEATSRDAETFLYNRYYLTEMIKKEYVKLDSCQTILMNIEDIDAEAIEKRGLAIRRAAEAALSLHKLNCHIYRYTPKEILVVMQNSDEESVHEFIDEWKDRMNFLTRDDDIQYAFLYGIACANAPFSIYQLVSECEKSILNQKTHNAVEIARDAEQRKYQNRLNRLREYLDEDYLSIYDINVAKDTYRTFVINSDTELRYIVPESGCYSEVYSQMINTYVSESESEDILRFGSLTNIVSQLKSEKRIEHTFETVSNTGVWRRLIFQAVERDENFLPIRVFMTVVAIDRSEVERIRQQAAIIDAFQRQQEQSDVRANFISRMSHDIRTPLNAIIGMTMLAKAANGDKAKLDNCLEKIDTASAQLLTLVNEILDITRIENGVDEVVESRFEVSEIIENVTIVAEPLMSERHHQFLTSMHDMSDEILYGDSHRMQRIVNNIISNSVKYTPDGGRVTMDLSEKPGADENHIVLRMVFSDNGVGMSQEFLKKIYDPFTRANDKRVEGQTGTGLGMAITHNLVEQLGGTIEIKSQLNVGTTTIIEIPLKIVRDEQEIAPKIIREQGVLVICNHKLCDTRTCTASGFCIKDAIEKHGIRVDMAELDDSALAMVEAQKNRGLHYFAVMINCDMYSERIGEIARQIRMLEGGSTPIVLITGGEWLSIELDARAKGVNFFMKRPTFMRAIFTIFEKIYNESIDTGESVYEEGLPDCTGKRILVAEDNDINAEIIMEIMNTTGAVIDRACNGRVAYEMMVDVPEHWYDLILMDVEMPEMNGYEATRAIRGLMRHDVATIPIVAMTANAFASDASKAREAGMNEHLTKPIEIDKLEKMLREYL